MEHRSFAIQKHPRPSILPLNVEPKVSVADYGENEWQLKTTHEAASGFVGPNYDETIEFVDITADDIVQLIAKDRANCERLWGQKMKHVIVGFDQMHELNIEFDRRQEMFGVQTYMDIIRNGVRRVISMTVHICPWFDGVLVLPDIENWSAK